MSDLGHTIINVACLAVLVGFGVMVGVAYVLSFAGWALSFFPRRR